MALYFRFLFLLNFLLFGRGLFAEESLKDSSACRGAFGSLYTLDYKGGAWHFAKKADSLKGGSAPDYKASPPETEIHPEVLQAAAQKVGRLRIAAGGKIRYGTGFFISPRRLITNAHVLDLVYKSGGRLQEFFVSVGGRSINIKEIVNISLLDDLAVLEAAEDYPFYFQLRDEPIEGSRGPHFFLVGYSGRPPLLAPDSPKIVKQIGKEVYYSEDRIFSFFSNSADLDGASGSPVLDQNGEISGVFFASSLNFAYSSSLDSLKNFIKESGRSACRGRSSKECFEAAFKALYEKAEEQDAAALYRLGLIYFKREYDIQNKEEEAVKLFESSAGLGFPYARYSLIIYYQNRKDSVNKAYSLVSQDLLEQGPLSEGALGAILQVNKSEEAFELFKISAARGSANAAYLLGRAYKKGLGAGGPDYKEAEFWLRRSAAYEDKDAIYELGMLFKETGDFENAFFYFKSAALKHHQAAQYELGIAYEQGLGASKNKKLAKYWKAVSEGDRLKAQGFFSFIKLEAGILWNLLIRKNSSF